MTSDEVLKIARDCGVEIAGMPHYQPQLERFAAAVERVTLAAIIHARAKDYGAGD